MSNLIKKSWMDSKCFSKWIIYTVRPRNTRPHRARTLNCLWFGLKHFHFPQIFANFPKKSYYLEKNRHKILANVLDFRPQALGFSRNTGYFRNQKTVYLKTLLKLSSTDLIVVIFLYTQKDYSGDYQLQCYGMNTDNSWTSGGESGYCAVYPELYEGARQAIRFCPCHYQTILTIEASYKALNE